MRQGQLVPLKDMIKFAGEIANFAVIPRNLATIVLKVSIHWRFILINLSTVRTSEIACYILFDPGGRIVVEIHWKTVTLVLISFQMFKLFCLENYSVLNLIVLFYTFWYWHRRCQYITYKVYIKYRLDQYTQIKLSHEINIFTAQY